MNNSGLSDRDVGILKGIFEKYTEIRLIILFGSRAKGNYKRGSDIDLAIMNELKDKSIINRIKEEIDESSLPYLTDILYYPELKHQELKDHINRAGLTFYESD